MAAESRSVDWVSSQVCEPRREGFLGFHTQCSASVLTSRVSPRRKTTKFPPTRISCGGNPFSHPQGTSLTRGPPAGLLVDMPRSCPARALSHSPMWQVLFPAEPEDLILWSFDFPLFPGKLGVKLLPVILAAPSFPPSLSEEKQVLLSFPLFYFCTPLQLLASWSHRGVLKGSESFRGGGESKEDRSLRSSGFGSRCFVCVGEEVDVRVGEGCFSISLYQSYISGWGNEVTVSEAGKNINDQSQALGAGTLTPE